MNWMSAWSDFSPTRSRNMMNSDRLYVPVTLTANSRVAFASRATTGSSGVSPLSIRANPTRAAAPAPGCPPSIGSMIPGGSGPPGMNGPGPRPKFP